jgi:hypothetical protein
MKGFFMSLDLMRGVVFVTAIGVAVLPPAIFAQAPKPAVEAVAAEFNVEQLDGMLAAIALYPDELVGTASV